jgi:hypothetical protein
VTDWELNTKKHSIDVDFTGYATINTIVVSATNMLTLSRHQQTYISNGGVCLKQSGQLGGMLIANERELGKRQQLMVDFEALQDGAWFLTLDASINGRWGALTNNRNDRYCIGLVVENGFITTFTAHHLNQVDALALFDKNRLLSFLNQELSVCFELSCWQTMTWMKDIWCHLASHHELMSDSNLRKIMPLTQSLPNEGDSESWVPQLHIGAYNTSIYTRSAKCYQHIDVGSSVNLRCIKAMAESYVDLGEALRKELIADAVVVGFENKEAVMAGPVKPKNLSLEMLRMILPAVFGEDLWLKILREDNKPALGDLLSGFHLAYTQLDFVKNARRTQTGNDFLRPSLNRLAFTYPKQGAVIMPILVADDFFVDEQEKELLEAMCYLSSGLAKACRGEARGKHKLHAITELLTTQLLDKNSLEAVLSFYMSVAGGLFHYYLLLWEVYYESSIEFKEV